MSKEYTIDAKVVDNKIVMTILGDNEKLSNIFNFSNDSYCNSNKLSETECDLKSDGNFTIKLDDSAITITFNNNGRLVTLGAFPNMLKTSWNDELDFKDFNDKYQKAISSLKEIIHII
jgi:hypothetical protein